jgi:DNA-binding PadR family transcriptional regulator
MGHGMWTDFEPTRRNRGGRGRGGHRHGMGHGGPWGGPWGGPMGGPPPWVTQMFGPDFAGGRGGRGGRRPRVRRGDVRSAILDVLAGAEGPINGYQVIQQIAERTDGVWKPSPGSVYPTISQLEDEGLVEDAPTGRKAIQLTDEGRTYVAEHPEEMAAVWAPFAEQADDDEAADFKQVIGQTVGAIVQVATTGTPDQRQKAIEILGDTRRRLYGLLAEGPDAGDAGDEGDGDEDFEEE